MSSLRVLIASLRSQARIASVFGVAVAAGLLTGTVIAAIPDTGGKIHGCYDSDGKVIVVDSGESCPEGQTALNWSQDATVLKQNLSGSDFSFSAMVNWDLSGLNLSNTTWYQARVNGSKIAGANVSGANFSNAFLDKTDMHGMNLSGLNFTSATLRRTNLTGVTLTNANLTAVIADQTDLSDLDLSGATLDGMSLEGANLSNATVATAVPFGWYAPSLIATNADFSGDKFMYGTFTDSDFSGADMSGTIFGDGNTIDFSRAKFIGTDFTGATFQVADLTGADFTDAILTDVTWVGVTCPDGTNIESNGNTCIGHLSL
jgi:uncharacterized protein YjbI with pentapeptide repeats